jgi:antibiotic biosynthesis monooxygenase (ABM) superfamily enzyme
MSIHVAITRRVLPGREAEFEAALREFFQASFSHGSVMGANMLTPAPGSDSREYGILRTFANEAERNAFYSSPNFRAWEEKARTMTEGEPSYRPLHGLEAFFHSADGAPTRWKMALATLVGVYPTSLLLGFLVAPQLHTLPKALVSLVIASCMVAQLTWVVMPLLTKLLHRWLHPHA